MRPLSQAAIAALALVTGTLTAEAHVELVSGPAFANKSQKITFGVGHGCTGADTYKIRIDIPAGITSVRAVASDFAKPSVVRDVNNVITAVVWQKPDADIQVEDIGYYELTIRARVGDVPFTSIPFTVTQTCRAADLTETTVVWDQPAGSTGNTAPQLRVVPPRITGWNKFTLGATTTVADTDLATYLGDAQIVWRGTAAYSSNALIAALITVTTGVTGLTGGLQANDEIWVKY
jgi:uncharacterized protein YcnI